jgi:hypothetical protein
MKALIRTILISVLTFAFVIPVAYRADSETRSAEEVWDNYELPEGEYKESYEPIRFKDGVIYADHESGRAYIVTSESDSSSSSVTTPSALEFPNIEDFNTPEEARDAFETFIVNAEARRMELFMMIIPALENSWDIAQDSLAGHMSYIGDLISQGAPESYSMEQALAVCEISILMGDPGSYEYAAAKYAIDEWITQLGCLYDSGGLTGTPFETEVQAVLNLLDEMKTIRDDIYGAYMEQLDLSEKIERAQEMLEDLDEFFGVYENYYIEDYDTEEPQEDEMPEDYMPMM